MTEDRHCLVVDRQPVVRLGISKLLSPSFEVEEAADWNAARDLLTEVGSFDVAVVDGDSAGSCEPAGAVLIRALRRERPGMGIVAYARRPDRIAAAQALDAGATAFVAKSSPAALLLEAVEAAIDREIYVDPAANAKANSGASLTKRQREILQLLANGHSTASAAEHLGLGTETIRTHTKAALARLEARDRTHAVAIGLRNGVID